MPTAGLVNRYWDKIPAQIFDNGIMANIFVLFDHYYNKCVVKTAQKYCDDMISTEWGRLDRDSLCPYTGEDERGNFEHPDQQSLKEYFDEKAKVTKYSQGAALFGGWPWDCMHAAIQTTMKIEKVMQFLVEAGYTPNAFLKPIAARAEEKAEMRSHISQFFSRALKGAFPEMESYHLFRSSTI